VTAVNPFRNGTELKAGQVRILLDCVYGPNQLIDINAVHHRAHAVPPFAGSAIRHLLDFEARAWFPRRSSFPVPSSTPHQEWQRILDDLRTRAAFHVAAGGFPITPKVRRSAISFRENPSSLARWMK
jgi:hypothetical protein